MGEDCHANCHRSTIAYRQTWNAREERDGDDHHDDDSGDDCDDHHHENDKDEGCDGNYHRNILNITNAASYEMMMSVLII